MIVQEITSTRILLTAQNRMRLEYTAEMKRVASDIRQVLVSHTNAAGLIPQVQATAVKVAAGDLLRRVFVGQDGRSPFGSDGVTALAPYPAMLNRWVAWVQYRAVKAQADWLKKHLPDDVLRYLQHGQRPVVSELSTEEIRAIAKRLGIFRPDPLLEYESAHTWVDPNGYRLSDRIWQNEELLRRKLDALLTEQIGAGVSATQIARLVDQWLIPGRAKVRTKKPYGSDGSFDALRLARTEITHAIGQVIITAARMNPYVEKIDWRLSLSHPQMDICDSYAAGGPYDPNNVPSYPPHPHCLCTLIPLVLRSIADVTEELRLMIEEARVPYLTPADLDGFLSYLIGDYLLRLALRVDALIEGALA